MKRERFQALVGRYAALRIAVIGDYCLDRYLDIDPALQETSIETGRPVHNVVRVRSQPGGAGTILANLVALGIRTLPVGFAGDDGEGFELERALRALSGVDLTHFLRTHQRRTFTYAKPLVHPPGGLPMELDRLDSKNWSPTPPDLEASLIKSIQAVLDQADAAILLEQTDQEGTGVLTARVRNRIGDWARQRPERVIVADSRRGLADYPCVSLKMNMSELTRMCGLSRVPDKEEVRAHARALAMERHRPVLVTLAEQGMVGADPDGATFHMAARPLRGAIDVVGAGDAVTANVCACLAAGGSVEEALLLATAAASVVLHKIGTTGTASIAELAAELEPTLT